MAYSDLAMLLRDPYAINVMCNSIMKTLSLLIQQEKLPRVSVKYFHKEFYIYQSL